MAQAQLSLPDTFDRALACHRTGDLGQAERLYRAILAEQPGHRDALHLLGVVAHQCGHHETALGLVDRAIAAGIASAEMFANRGRILAALHRPEEALASFERALALQPNEAALHFSCGNALYALKRLEAALAAYERAVALRPDHAETLNNRGLTLHHLQRFGAALESYDKALALRPDFADALNNRGNAFEALQRFEDALASYDAVLALRPHQAETHYNRANALKALGRFEEALTGYEHALKLRPDLANAHNNRGATLRALRRFEAALASYDAVLALRPSQAEAHYNRANTLKDLGRFEEALTEYDRALALRPDYAEALNSRGGLLHEMERFDEALANCAQALAFRPDDARTLTNRGVVLHEMKRFDEALASHAQALALRPDFAEAHYNRGNTLCELRRFDEALASYAQAEAIDPDLAGAHWNEGLCRLLRGDLARGWPKFEWRWKIGDLAPVPRNFSAPLWLGKEDLAGKTILLHHEGGFGDTIQFCRYVPLVAARANVVLEVPDSLIRLLKTLPGEKRIVARGEALPAVDLHCPLLSLPSAFQTSLATIPGAVPYLAADPDQVVSWRRRLHAFPGLRVGLVWSGNRDMPGLRAHPYDRRRSVALDRFAALADIPCVTFVSLQKGDAAAQRRGSAFDGRMLDWTEELNDFADTAALIEMLDLIISVDTAVAHLAGALAKPVWLLNRFDTEWRWLLDRDDSPWYPTLRQFRQPARGDWDTVIARVAAELSTGFAVSH